jgi:hypothetical protein
VGTCVAWLAAQAAWAADLSATEIVEKNVAARGGLQAWRGVKTLTLSGEMDAGGKQDARLPFVLSMKRPHQSRLEIRFQDKTALQVYDGKQGWKLRPFLNRNEVEAYTAGEAKSAAAGQELDGPLVDYVAKGTKVELIGHEAVEGADAYKLRLVLKSGEQRHVWINASTFLEAKIDGDPRRLDGKMHPVAVFYRDYKTVDGLTLPHTLETAVDGVKQTHKISVQAIAVNKPLDEALFAKPQLAMAKTPTR